jgi:hypothetical protein
MAITGWPNCLKNYCRESEVKVIGREKPVALEKELGKPTPCNSTIVSIVHQVEATGDLQDR